MSGLYLRGARGFQPSEFITAALGDVLPAQVEIGQKAKRHSSERLDPKKVRLQCRSVVMSSKILFQASA